MVAKPLCPLYKNIIKPLDRARYPELRYIYSIPYLLIKLKKFFTIIYQILEFNTFRMVQKEQIECLVDGTDLYFFITKLRQKESDNPQ